MGAAGRRNLLGLYLDSGTGIVYTKAERALAAAPHIAKTKYENHRKKQLMGLTSSRAAAPPRRGGATHRGVAKGRGSSAAAKAVEAGPASFDYTILLEDGRINYLVAGGDEGLGAHACHD